jgi:hypothetical protein
MMDSKTVSPHDSIPKNDGWNRASGERKRLFQSSKFISKLFFKKLEVAAVEISWSVLEELLPDVTNDLMINAGKLIATLEKDLHQEVGQVTFGQIQKEDGMV